jgi:hypothetical protein
MHETSLEGTIRDYLTGEAVPNTTFEDLRQALAKHLVEEKGFERKALKPKLPLVVSVQEDSAELSIDLGAFTLENDPVLAVVFCFGKPGTFVRQGLAMARLADQGPFPLVLITDTREFFLVRTGDQKVLLQGSQELPSWDTIREMAGQAPLWEADEKKRLGEKRILLAYCSLSGPCCGDSCTTEPQ